jgi:uncharacterized protein (TIGR02466 family)
MSNLSVFNTLISIDEVPMFIDSLNKLSIKYLNEVKKPYTQMYKQRNKFLKKDIGDFGLSLHSKSFFNDKKVIDFVNYCGGKSYNLLNDMGYDLSNHSLNFNDMWVQEFSEKGGGHHSAHLHSNNHISGFYFLECSERTSYSIFYDPRPGAVMSALPLKNSSELSAGNNTVFIKPKPGTMVIFPSYLAHEFTVDYGIDKFKFIHWNIQCVPTNTLKK